MIANRLRAPAARVKRRSLAPRQVYLTTWGFPALRQNAAFYWQSFITRIPFRHSKAGRTCVAYETGALMAGLAVSAATKSMSPMRRCLLRDLKDAGEMLSPPTLCAGADRTLSSPDGE